MSAILEDIKERLAQQAGDDVHFDNDDQCVVELSAIRSVLTFLRNDPVCAFEQLTDVCGVDYLGRKPRFDVVYHLLSLQRNVRLRLRVAVDEDGIVPSVTSIWACASWYEREVWDMFGIAFSDHPDLRRILTDYEFDGYPLRKDFPLSGHHEVHYDEASQQLRRVPVQLAQGYRDFDFESPWQGMMSASRSRDDS